MKTIKVPNEAFKFIAWLVRQDVTLPAVMTHHLKWNHFSEQEIKSHFLDLNMACIEAEKE